MLLSVWNHFRLGRIFFVSLNLTIICKKTIDHLGFTTCITYFNNSKLSLLFLCGQHFCSYYYSCQSFLPTKKPMYIPDTFISWHNFCRLHIVQYFFPHGFGATLSSVFQHEADDDHSFHYLGHEHFVSSSMPCLSFGRWMKEIVSELYCCSFICKFGRKHSKLALLSRSRSHHCLTSVVCGWC